MNKKTSTAFEALCAINARISGEFDNPALEAFGPLSTSQEADCLEIAIEALHKITPEWGLQENQNLSYKERQTIIEALSDKAILLESLQTDLDPVTARRESEQIRRLQRKFLVLLKGETVNASA